MPITTLSSREFQQNANQAQKAAKNGPVIITNRGRPSQVLLSFDEYQRITASKRSLINALSMPGLSEIDLQPPTARDLPRPADLS